MRDAGVLAPGRAPAPAAPSAARLLLAPSHAGLRARAWTAYLAVAIVGAAIVVPGGPAQTALLDPINALALLAFAAAVAARPTRVEVPFAVPMLVILGSSLVAMTNAAAVGDGFLTLAQDVYLYLWFVALVALFERRGALVGLRVTWVVMALVVVAIGFVHLVLAGKHYPQDLWRPEGERMAATFYNPNMCADYLVLSYFVVLGLFGQVRRWFLLLALGVLTIGMMLTKSNGGFISLGVGSAVAAGTWAWTGGPRTRRRWAVAACVVLATGLLTWRAANEGFVQGAVFEKMRQGSFLNRVNESGEQRGHIWKDLLQNYKAAPLGIGPGNSTAHTVAIGERERPNSLQSKEAHNDYLAYTVERGPAAILALLAWIGLMLAMVVRGRHALAARVGGGAAGRALYASFLGALVATAVHSTVIEKLHFRHFWVFLALACAMTAAARTPLAASQRRAAP